MNGKITTTKSKQQDLTWVNIINAGAKEIDYLKRKFKFNDLDLADSYAQTYSQRPKFYQRDKYCFLILQFPVFDNWQQTIKAEEVDFYLSKNYLITLHRNNLKPLVELFSLCADEEFYRDQYLSDNNAAVLAEIIGRLQEYCYPLLDKLSLEIKVIEKSIFAGQEKDMVNKILAVKRNILNFRKIMEAHKNIIQKINHENISFFPTEKSKIYYQELIENTKNIWDILESQKEMIEALEATNNTLISSKLNQIMKVLTISSLVIFSLTLCASIFSTNLSSQTPFINHPHGFFILLSIMMLVGLTVILILKRKKWL